MEITLEVSRVERTSTGSFKMSKQSLCNACVPLTYEDQERQKSKSAITPKADLIKLNYTFRNTYYNVKKKTPEPKHIDRY